MAPLRVVYLGSDEMACPALRKLASDPRFLLAGIVTQPDRPAGRNRELTPSAVARMAANLAVPLWRPEKIGAVEMVQSLAAVQPDLLMVAAYGQYIPSSILKLSRFGAINLHPSLLPRYRGAAPVEWAIANGDALTGVSIIDVAGEMDAGDVWMQQSHPIRADDTTASLSRRLADLGADMLLEVAMQIVAGEARRIAQDPAYVTLAPKLTKEDGRLDWRMPARQLEPRIRGFYPWPGCYCEIHGLRVKVLRARVESGRGAPGLILAADAAGPLVVCGEDALRLLDVQPAGKKPMSGEAFLLGHRLRPGQQLT